MTATSPGFVGARLAQARKARGLTAVSLAEILGITSASISQYEHDKQAPRPELTERLAVQLNVPPTFFLREVTPSTHERATKWRSNTTATKFARERAEIRYEWLREIVEYLGSFLNFPTLNIPWSPDARPRLGVYAVRVAGSKSATPLPAVANFGLRPTVEQSSEPRLEAHLLGECPFGKNDFVTVEWLHFLRPERKFTGLDELRAQIALDRTAAADFFGT